MGSVPPPADEASAGPPADHEAVARTILLDQLTGRARSRSELAAALARKGVPDDVAVRALDRFEEVGLIDDAAFAAAWVESRHSTRGLARRALKVELQRKGVAPEVITEATGVLDEDDERAAARELVRRRRRSLARFDAVTQTRRLTGLLARKGYPPGLAYSVVREELADIGGESGFERHESDIDG